jgi:hypothetical protein
VHRTPASQPTNNNNFPTKKHADDTSDEIVLPLPLYHYCNINVVVVLFFLLYYSNINLSFFFFLLITIFTVHQRPESQ